MSQMAQYSIGDSDFFFHTVEREEIEYFAKISGDDNPIHTDIAFARANGKKDLVSHGMLTAALVSRFIGTRMPGHGALWTEQQFEFLGTVHPGDTLKIVGIISKVLEKTLSIVIDFQVLNQDKKVVLSGRGTVKVPTPKPALDPIAPTDRKLSVRALVIGASGSLGSTVMSKLAQHDVNTLGTFRLNPNGLEAHVDKLAAEGRLAQSFQLDTTSMSSINQLLKFFSDEWGTPDIIINCGSLPPTGKKIEDLEYEYLNLAINTEIMGFLKIIQFCVPNMKARKFGRIISIGSTATIDRPEIGWASYTVSKSVVAQLSKSLAVELGSYGITSNVVSPGMAETGMAADFSVQAKLAARAQTPSNKLVKHDQVADYVEFLCKESSGFMNGQNVILDAGRTMQ